MTRGDDSKTQAHSSTARDLKKKDGKKDVRAERREQDLPEQQKMVKNLVVDELTIDETEIQDKERRRETLQEELQRKAEEEEATPLTVANMKKAMEEVLVAKMEGRLETFEKNITEKQEKLSSVCHEIALRQLDADMHNRKWNVILTGVKGKAKETSAETREIVIKLFRNTLNIELTSAAFAALHRLNFKVQDSAIILRLHDLQTKYDIFAQVHKLPKEIHITQDIPPTLRPLRSEVLDIRNKTTKYQKKDMKVRYLQSWPYIVVKVDEKKIIEPKTTAIEIVEKYLTREK